MVTYLLGIPPDATPPDATLPDGTPPDGTLPDGTLLDGTVPDGLTMVKLLGSTAFFLSWEKLVLPWDCGF